jgi:hypothetical protein
MFWFRSVRGCVWFKLLLVRERVPGPRKIGCSALWSASWAAQQKEPQVCVQLTKHKDFSSLSFKTHRPTDRSRRRLPCCNSRQQRRPDLAFSIPCFAADAILFLCWTLMRKQCINALKTRSFEVSCWIIFSLNYFFVELCSWFKIWSIWIDLESWFSHYSDLNLSAPAAQCTFGLSLFDVLCCALFAVYQLRASSK